jgi:hypothetical protein
MNDSVSKVCASVDQTSRIILPVSDSQSYQQSMKNKRFPSNKNFRSGEPALTKKSKRTGEIDRPILSIQISLLRICNRSNSVG